MLPDFLYALCCYGDILCNIISSSLVFFCTLFIARQKLMNRLRFVLNSKSQLKPARIHTNANHINIVRLSTFNGCLNRQTIIEYCFIIFSSSILLVYDCNKLLLYYIDRGGVKKVLGILKKFFCLLFCPSCHLDSALLHLDEGFRPMLLKSKTARKEHKCSFLAVSAFTRA